MGPVKYLFFALLFVMIWFGGMGAFISGVIVISLAGGNLTGIEAFIIANWQLWIFIALMLSVIAFVWIGGKSG